MTTIAQVAAVLLALFFTAVSVVASTAYSKVTTEVRALVPHDDINRRYLRLLAHTAATSTTGIALHVAGIAASPLLAGYVLLLAVICILAFFPIGIRTFALFDPASLAGYPTRVFVRASRRATNKGRHWLDTSFQNHAQGIADKQLGLLDDLMVFAVSDDRPRQHTALAIMKTTHRLARYYSAQKGTIPSDSMWFPRKPEFRRWQAISSSVTQIALQTGITPSPDTAPDHGFVESRCIEITLRCLRHLLKRDADHEIVTLLLEVNKTATSYARLLEQTEAMRLVEAVRPLIVERLKAAEHPPSTLLHLQIVDVLCVAALASILNSPRSLTEQPVEQLLCLDRSLLNLDRRHLYRKTHPRAVLKEAEGLFRRLEFERATEGTICTQAWYIRQLIAFAYADTVRNVIANIVITIEGEFVEPAIQLVEAKKSLPAGVWLQRGIEACRKATDQIESLEDLYARLKEHHITELVWEPSGGNAALKTVAVHRTKIITLLAAIVPDLCKGPSADHLPDLLGQARAVIADEIVSMLRLKEEEGFAELFLAYFHASLRVYEQYGTFAQEPGKSDYMRAATDILIDVLSVSGLALLFSELDGTLFGRVVESAWDTYLRQVADPKVVVEIWIRTVELSTTTPIFSPSAMQRQEWKREFANAMVDRGVQPGRELGPQLEWEDYQPHKSAVIESIHVHYGHLMTEPHEYFTALYLVRREEAKEIKLPSGAERCIHSIEKATIRQRKAADAKQAKSRHQ